MEKTIERYNGKFESSSEMTSEFRNFRLLFKREFNKFLKEHHAIASDIHAGHFELTGFFTMASGKIWYFSTGDVRWLKGKMLIRTAKDYVDYTGGTNQYVPMDNYENFKVTFESIVN